VAVIDIWVANNGQQAAREKARELLALLRGNAGQDPWKLVLDGTFSVRKLVVRPDLEKALYDSARKLSPQEISGVIDTPMGLHIIKLDSYSPERPLAFEEAKPAIEAKLKGAALEKATKVWEQELMKGAMIERLDNGKTL
jgi:parvulin-like peptidyl-prolyl cis-trans isomerase-like protein